MDTKSFNNKNFDKSRAVCEGIEREDGGGDYKTEANKLHNQLNASERKSESRLRQIDYLESVIRKRNAELKERKQLIHELRNEVRRLGKQVSDLATEREEGDGRVALTDREREILDMWQKFEDGEYVWFGDEVEADPIFGGGTNVANSIEFMSFTYIFKNDIGKPIAQDGFKTRAKRPVQSVLDADGVEIHVGDTVWHCNGIASGVVTSIDAGSLMNTTRYVDESGTEFRDAARSLTHTRPDSWERLEEDAEFNDETGIVGGNLDIVRRAKALAGAGE